MNTSTRKIKLNISHSTHEIRRNWREKRGREKEGEERGERKGKGERGREGREREGEGERTTISTMLMMLLLTINGFRVRV